MGLSYQIHPKIGVARLGNSVHGFYVGPEATGGLPIECDQHGTALIENGRPVPVRKFKDATGAIKRQAARFSVYLHDDQGPAGERRARYWPGTTAWRASAGPCISPTRSRSGSRPNACRCPLSGGLVAP